MQVNSLDHVNIFAKDLDATARFYADLLDLERRDAPPPLTPDNVQWLHDRSGKAILHINSVDCPRFFPREVVSGPTGSIHHVAFGCSGYADLIARLEARGAEFHCNTVTAIGLRQVFTMDPNGVLLELNFFGD